MSRRETKTLERGSPGKRVKRVGSQGECALIRDQGRCIFVARRMDEELRNEAWEQ